ncbi:MAG: rRNA maturation RNase YbeY [Mariprofundales bacterium]
MMIEILRDQPWPKIAADKVLQRSVATALTIGGIAAEQVSLCVRLADDATMRQLNSQWRQIDAPTDVLSFPMQDDAIDPTQPLGDIVIAIPFVREAAAQLQLPINDHLSHLLIHGALHLLGHDHMEPEDQACMRALERQAMTALNLHDPWPTEGDQP